MRHSSTKPVIDFTGYIVENTRDFTGREWVFQAVNDWLASPWGTPKHFAVSFAVSPQPISLSTLHHLPLVRVK